jgi:nicotinate-nucleotide adenylyltransferase
VSSRAERLGIFGGTFDPPHVGHLVTAVNVRHDLGLDRVLLVVNNQPWQKVGKRAITPAEDRFALVEAAVARVEGLEASRIEIERGGMSYTADTLLELAKGGGGGAAAHDAGGGGGAAAHDAGGGGGAAAHDAGGPVPELFVILGADAAAGLTTWEQADAVRDLATVVVVDRPGAQAAAPLPGWSWLRVEVPRLEESSTDLRARVVDGRPLDYLLPSGVIATIRQRALYDDRGNP